LDEKVGCSGAEIAGAALTLAAQEGVDDSVRRHEWRDIATGDVRRLRMIHREQAAGLRGADDALEALDAQRPGTVDVSEIVVDGCVERHGEPPLPNGRKRARPLKGST
jgi:hypothetical protein